MARPTNAEVALIIGWKFKGTFKEAISRERRTGIFEDTSLWVDKRGGPHWDPPSFTGNTDKALLAVACLGLNVIIAGGPGNYVAGVGTEPLALKIRSTHDTVAEAVSAAVIAWAKVNKKLAEV